MLSKLKIKATETVSRTRASATLAATYAKEQAIAAKLAAQETGRKTNELIKTKISSSINKENVSKNPDEESKTSEAGDEEEASLLDELNQSCKLTKRQRLYGAVACYAFGAIFSLLATFSLMSHGKKHVAAFAFFYTLGSISSMGSSMFLVGPCRQIRIMCHPVRRVACTIWISTMIATLVLAFTYSKAGLLILFLIMIQYCAMFYYGLSYIPYGRTLIRKCCNRAASQAATV